MCRLGPRRGLRLRSAWLLGVASWLLELWDIVVNRKYLGFRERDVKSDQIMGLSLSRSIVELIVVSRQ